MAVFGVTGRGEGRSMEARGFWIGEGVASDLSEDALVNLAPLGVVGAGLWPGVSDKPDLSFEDMAAQQVKLKAVVTADNNKFKKTEPKVYFFVWELVSKGRREMLLNC